MAERIQQLYKAAELAAILNVNPQTIYRAKDNGLLEFYKVGKSVRFPMPSRKTVEKIKGDCE